MFLDVSRCFWLFFPSVFAVLGVFLVFSGVFGCFGFFWVFFFGGGFQCFLVL